MLPVCPWARQLTPVSHPNCWFDLKNLNDHWSYRVKNLFSGTLAVAQIGCKSMRPEGVHVLGIEPVTLPSSFFNLEAVLPSITGPVDEARHAKMHPEIRCRLAAQWGIYIENVLMTASVDPSTTLQLQVESKQSCQDTIEILFQQQVLISVARRDVVSLSLSPR